MGFVNRWRALGLGFVFLVIHPLIHHSYNYLNRRVVVDVEERTRVVGLELEFRVVYQAEPST